MRGKWTTALAVLVLAVAFSTVVNAAEWWDYPGDWQVCRDSDGWVVYKPDGGEDAWGTGYTLTQIEASYGLSGRRWGGRNDRLCA